MGVVVVVPRDVQVAQVFQLRFGGAVDGGWWMVDGGCD
jgi:hypothetical protein